MDPEKNGPRYPEMFPDPTAPQTTFEELIGEKRYNSISDRIYNAASYLRLPTPVAEFYDNTAKLYAGCCDGAFGLLRFKAWMTWNTGCMLTAFVNSALAPSNR